MKSYSFGNWGPNAKFHNPRTTPSWRIWVRGGLPRICCVGCRGYVAWVAEDMFQFLRKTSQLPVLLGSLTITLKYTSLKILIFWHLLHLKDILTFLWWLWMIVKSIYFNIVQRISIKQFILIQSYFFFHINHVTTNIIHAGDKIYRDIY